MGQQQAPWMSTLTDYEQFGVTLESTVKRLPLNFLFFFAADIHVTPLPFINWDLWVSCNTTCKSEGGVFKAISPLQKELHVNKNKTSTLHSNNAALPPILCSLSLTTSHPLGVSRPSFMFKDYLLIQNVQEHETAGKGPILRREGGRDAWLYLFVGFHINPLEHSAFYPSFPGMCKCFRAIKWKMEFSMDSM